MKAAHRHELETNVLAKRLQGAIDRFRPYAATLAGVVLAIVVIMFVWSYVSGSTASRQGAAWDAYHRAVAGGAPNIEQLRRSAEEYPGTKMQQLADVTWADGQVYMASQQFLYNRAAAMSALERAESAYQGLLQTSDDERIVNRGRLGLARIYEMRNELDKARQEYLKVIGAYAEYAKLQADRLAKPETQEDYAWLAKAEAVQPRAPFGPGVPGQRPAFSAGDFPLPGAEPEPGSPDGEPAAGDSFESLLRGLEMNFPSSAETGDSRYDIDPNAPPSEDGIPAEAPASETPPPNEPQPGESQ